MTKGVSKELAQVILSVLCSAVLAAPGHVAAEVKDRNLTGIRAYSDGNMHLYFSSEITPACGSVVRVSGPGTESIRTLALAALMSGRGLTVEVDPAKSGNFCNLVYLRLDK